MTIQFVGSLNRSVYISFKKIKITLNLILIRSNEGEKFLSYLTFTIYHKENNRIILMVTTWSFLLSSNLILSKQLVNHYLFFSLHQYNNVKKQAKVASFNKAY